MDKKTQMLGVVLVVAMLMILIPVVLNLLLIDWPWLNYVFATGAVAALVVRILDRYNGDNLRIKRLYRIATVSAICYCLSAYLKFSAELYIFPYATGRDWLAFMMAGAALQVYTAFMIDHAEKKEKERKLKNRK